MGRKSSASAGADYLGGASPPVGWQSALPAQLVVGCIILAGFACSGCRERRPPKKLGMAQIEAWADLPGVRVSRDSELQAELARVVEAHGTPRQLIAAPLPDAENAATALVGLFDIPQLSRGLQQTERWMPGNTFPTDSPPRDEVAALLQAYTRQLHEIPLALRRPACQFATQFECGFFAARPYIDVVTLSVRLEALRVVILLDQNRPHAASAPLQTMFHLTALLAADKLVASRLTAAQLRILTLGATARWVTHPQLTGDDLLDMSWTLDRLLSDWPDDANAWIGDRGVALHSYEAIRAGYLLPLLTPAETDSLRAEGLLDGLADRLSQSIDQDELFYLTTMRKIIASCALPYDQRQKTLTEIAQQLHARRNSPDFPFVAGRLFLAGVEQGHYRQAEDRARCEAWSLALALATDQPRPPYRTNPATGVVYAVDVTPQRVQVITGHDGKLVIDLPRLRHSGGQRQSFMEQGAVPGGGNWQGDVVAPHATNATAEDHPFLQGITGKVMDDTRTALSVPLGSHVTRIVRTDEQCERQARIGPTE